MKKKLKRGKIDFKRKTIWKSNIFFLNINGRVLKIGDGIFFDRVIQ